MADSRSESDTLRHTKSACYFNTIMFSIRRPTDAAIKRFIDDQSERDFSYAAVGATATEPPDRFTVDHTRGLLGHGRTAFDCAKAALPEWRHFQLGWVEPYWPETTIEEGRVVGILARSCGLWFLNACRIVYVVDENGPITRYGFAYGTLPEHAESGEERFSIERHAVDDSVWYDVLAFSRPNKWYTRLCYPYVRRVQRRFARDSVAAMQESVKPVAQETLDSTSA